MPATLRNKNKHTGTKKNKNALVVCPIGLKPFEAEFGKTFTKGEKKSTAKRKQEFVKQLLSKFAPNSLKPENNFYAYINYQWIKNVSVEQQQKYIVQVDDFRLTQDQVYQELDEIIVKYVKTHSDKLARNLKNYRKSVIEMNPKPYSRKLALEAVSTIESLFEEGKPWKLLAFFNNDEMLCNSAPFAWSINPNEKNAKVYCSYVSAHQFELVDLNVYYDDGTDEEYKKKYRAAYNRFVKDIFNILLGHNDYNPQDVFDVEVELFNSFVCEGVVVKDPDSTYNKVYASEALSKYDFDWVEFAKELGYKQAPSFFVTGSLPYLKCASNVFLKNWNTPKWKTYWLYILLKRLVRITRGWEDIIYKFKGDFERGQQQINKSDAVSAALYMSVPFNTFLTNEYVKKYENPQSMQYVKIMCDDLKIVFKRILERNTWLQPSTKKYALKKLEHFNFVYGKPEGLREDPDLNYGTLLYDNMQKINAWRHQKFINLEGKPLIDIPLMDWNMYPVKMIGTQAYIVNASYTPAKNSIYINLGYIQKPFVDLDERGIEYNLAHIGNTIAHELSHGFDDTGSKYGWDGNLYDWWTPADKKKYKAIQQDVINQYEQFHARDGIKYDASIGIGESLADISALAICDEYLRDFQEKNDDLIPIRYLSYEGFYTYFAFQQRQEVGKKALIAQLKTNPHPLSEYRCNVPLSRSEIFRALYDVKKGDGMWWHNTNTIW
jgi:predicted metalloendopeptidase